MNNKNSGADELCSLTELRIDDCEGRSFLLGNKRGLMLSLPAANGRRPARSHPTKWFGAFRLGTKFLDGHTVSATPGTTRVAGRANQAISDPARVHGHARAPQARVRHYLGEASQTSFTLRLADAVRSFDVDGTPVTERFFVPDGIDAFACRLEGDAIFRVQPRFDIRRALALPGSMAAYAVEHIDNGVLVSNGLANGPFDDLRETFTGSCLDAAAPRAYVAVQVVADDARKRSIRRCRRIRAVEYEGDRNRARLLEEHAPFVPAVPTGAPAENGDHAPLWRAGTARVFLPVSFEFSGGGTVFYGFGESKEEALANLTAVREGFPKLVAAKERTARQTLDRAAFRTGNREVDLAWNLVLSRLTDALVLEGATVGGEAQAMILAGNQYFQDAWKRDENIALGALLGLGMFDIAKAIVNDTWQKQDPVTGRLPQRIRAGEEPAYHSSDGTLWAMLRLDEYVRATGDQAMLDDKIALVMHFFRRSLGRVTCGMLPSGKQVHDEYLWETWMDTPFTPRDGYPIEIQLLWIACLRAFVPVIAKRDAELARAMTRTLTQALESLSRFTASSLPADSLDWELQPRAELTPNPYFAFAVGVDLGDEMEQAMRCEGAEQLRGEQGVRTLSPRDWARVLGEEFLGNSDFVSSEHMRSAGKFNYHRGVEWNWLVQLFSQGELKAHDADRAYEWIRPLVNATLENGGIGGISELFEPAGPLGPDYQTWSMTALLSSLQAFAGVSVDVPNKRIVVRPHIPASWPGLHIKQRFGDVPFTVEFARTEYGGIVCISFPNGRPDGLQVELDPAYCGPNCTAVIK